MPQFFYLENIPNEKQREKKTTAFQYQIYVEFLEANPDVVYKKLDPTLDANHFSDKWEELKTLLNSSGKGPQKTVEQWQSVSKH